MTQNTASAPCLSIFLVFDCGGFGWRRTTSYILLPYFFYLPMSLCQEQALRRDMPVTVPGGCGARLGRHGAVCVRVCGTSLSRT
ncbi:hypothetical protein K439DRAFT_1088130 [Ramaria rubella]|nr:hypothetical protein K439DRAFT_1088130 [Ramaria rubella]